MKLVALRWSLVGTIVALLAALVLAWLRDVDQKEHGAYAWALRRALELDARFNEEVAKARLGIVTHYDGLVRVSDAHRAVGLELDAPPAHVPDDHAEELVREVAAYRDALAEKEELVESFKSEQALLRNSLRAFVHNSDRLLERLGDEAEAASVVSAVRELEHDVMKVAILPSAEGFADARCALWSLGGDVEAECPGERVAVPATVAGELGSVLRHGRVIVERQATVESLVEQIMTLPVAALAAEAADTYAAAHARAVETSSLRWLVVYVLSFAAILFCAAFIILRLHVSAVALRATTDKLADAMAALERERDREKELASLKSRFVAMTSHEYRTPLSVIVSSAELLQAYWAKWTEEKRETHLQRIVEAARGMSRMLDGVLLIGRAEAGMLELNPQPLRLRELCDTIVDELKAVAGDRVVEYANEAPDEDVWMDEKLLRHILTNLLSNAFKYSHPEGRVRFEVRPNGRGVIFDIRDEGMGIPKDEQPGLFDAFQRCSNASGVPGHGLGLAIVKRSLDVHGGTISVDSDVGKGTRFEVAVPFAEGTA